MRLGMKQTSVTPLMLESTRQRAPPPINLLSRTSADKSLDFQIWNDRSPVAEEPMVIRFYVHTNTDANTSLQIITWPLQKLQGIQAEFATDAVAEARSDGKNGAVALRNL